MSALALGLKFVACAKIININRLCSFSTMANFTVRFGLNLERNLQRADTQMLLIGRKTMLNAVDFNKNLTAKLAPFVDEELFKRGMAQLNASGGSVPLYLNMVKVASISETLSRYNTPSNSYSIYKEVKALQIAKGVKNLNIVLYTDYANVMASVVALARAFPLYSKKTRKDSCLENIELEIVVPETETISEQDLGFLQSLCDNVRTCCRLVDTPTNTLHTETFLEESLAMVDSLGMPVEKTIIKGKELEEKGFGGIYNVGKAATHPPVFVCFSYTPKDATLSYALVGKGIVYDTGGLTLKGRTSMPNMKSDMAGAAGMIATFCTLVKNGFNQNLHCLLCMAENHISPEATRPDDIITMLSGKTVEVNNTDAEGRLVLADGVFYAKETLKVGTVIDMATLTGAQPGATGKYHAAILCNSEQLETDCVKAGRKSGDLVHPLPFLPELHFCDLNSKVADMKNACLSAESMSGPPTAIAGLFIGSHINFGLSGNATESATSNGNGCNTEVINSTGNNNKVDWLHIDMCGPTMLGRWDGRATAYGVALLCALLGKHTDIGVVKYE